ncbi:ABC transporter ATP-binding protein [Clostridium sp. Cult1]|uniref:ABC transporter ATP-binding protein n=1 Tax=Clostridium sp. Cult1 TaxID=2079002 RepID=UPI001F3448CE|nr:ABC transporter ATP-binding protein [Clostridium sp. Cult1]MCF6461879.1 ABC transporter ATP-binding protein [Clostridium sp. Cult1]
MKAFKTLKEFFISNKWNYLFGIVWLIVIDSVQLIVPQILRTATDLLENRMLTFQGLIKYSLYIILTGLIIAIGRYFWRIYILGTSRRMEYYLRKKLFGHLLTLPPNYYDTHKTGDLMAHATNDINAIRHALGQGIIMFIDSIFLTFLTIIMMVKTTTLKLTIIALFTLPFITIMVRQFGKVIHRRFRLVQEAFSDLTDAAQESFAGIRVIKSFVQEDLVTENFTKVNQNNFEKNLQLVKVSGIFHPLIQFISSISFFIVIIYGGRLVILDIISLGDFIAFNNYLSLLIWPMMAMGWVINLLQRGIASMERINAILEVKPEIIDSNTALELNSLKGKIEFKNVYFKYPLSTDYVLKDINFTIDKGNTLAIVGRTGSGKTTIINLLLRLYETEKGNILLDNINIKDIKIKSIRENISYVPQDNFLFTTTIRENIGFAFDIPIEEERMIESSKLAQVYDNIVDFPKKFDTVLGERGVTLSGGQKQRVSIARALAKDAPILILDDSLSSVDTETEEKILNQLESITNKKTTIIVSHRISTVKDADEIIVLDEGRIIERGDHDTLLKIDGLYRYLYEKQLLEEKISGD